MIVHIGHNYYYGWGWIIWPFILGLFTNTFCNRKTRQILTGLGLGLHAVLLLIHFSDLP